MQASCYLPALIVAIFNFHKYSDEYEDIAFIAGYYSLQSRCTVPDVPGTVPSVPQLLLQHRKIHCDYDRLLIDCINITQIEKQSRNCNP